MKAFYNLQYSKGDWKSFIWSQFANNYTCIPRPCDSCLRLIKLKNELCHGEGLYVDDGGNRCVYDKPSEKEFNDCVNDIINKIIYNNPKAIAFKTLYELLNANMITLENLQIHSSNNETLYLVHQTNPPLPPDTIYNLIHDQTINAFKSYKGNWVMNAFNSQRQEEVFNYICRKVNTIPQDKLKEAFERIINEIAQIDVKPYGEN